MKIKLILIFLLIINFKSFACLNGESKILKSGHYLYEDYDDILPFGHNFYEGDFEEMVFKLDSLYKKTNDLAYLSDKGLILILQKKYSEAIKLYLKIEKLEPNRYSTASNLGTIYELIGENQKALEWIKKSIEINPKSHSDSEWIHVKILEAKIKGEKYFTSKFLLDLDFGNEDKPLSNYDKAILDKLEKAIHYQLNERISFIKPKDKIISILLFELGNIKILKKDNRNAKEIFKKAKEYGLDSELLNRRIAFTNIPLKTKQKQHANSPEKSKPVINYTKTISLVLAIILALTIVFIFLKRTRK